MPFVDLTDMLETMSGPELDAALQAVLAHIEDQDLLQVIQVVPGRTRKTLRAMLDQVEAQDAEIEDAVAAERGKAQRTVLVFEGEEHELHAIGGPDSEFLELRPAVEEEEF